MKSKHLLPRIALAAAIGMAASLAAGGAEIAAPVPDFDPAAQGSLSIHKYAGAPDASLAHDGTEQTVTGKDPLSGVTFTLCKVDGLDVTSPNAWDTVSDLKVSSTGVITDAKSATYGCTKVSDVVTNAAGLAEWPVLDLGVYVVTESSVPSTVVKKVDPFLVSIPLPHTSDTGATGWLYDVNVYPKNTVNSIEKSITDPGAIGVGAKVKWNITVRVPEMTDPITSFIVTDQLDKRLTHVDAVTAVHDGNPITPTSAAADANKLLRVEFDPADLISNKDVVITFYTTVDRIHCDSALGDPATCVDGSISNDATIFTNDPTLTTGTSTGGTGGGGGGGGGGDPEPAVTTTWGGIQITKVAEGTTKQKLAGASFMVFGSAADAQACADTVSATSAGASTECTGKAVAVSGNQKFTSSATGIVTINGLLVSVKGEASRDYYLVEVAAPIGYVLPAKTSNVATVTVVPGGLTANTMTIENTAGGKNILGELPLTGAAGTLMLILGALVLGGGATLLVASNRAKAQRL